MKEKVFSSTQELFSARAPDLLEYLSSDDVFWSQIRDNSITDEDLLRHQAILDELGINYPSSAVAKAIQLLIDSRKNSLPTPVKFTF